jgi:hypothetical protein
MLRTHVPVASHLPSGHASLQQIPPTQWLEVHAASDAHMDPFSVPLKHFPESHRAPAAQSADAAHFVRHAPATLSQPNGAHGSDAHRFVVPQSPVLPSHALGAQSCMLGAQLPTPSHASPFEELPTHEASLEQLVCGSVPLFAGSQMPSFTPDCFAAAAQASQFPSQGVAQHTASTHWPVTHSRHPAALQSAAGLHAAPCAFCGLQVPSAAQ